MEDVRARRPCGTWPSPLSAEMVAAEGLRLSGVALDGDDLYWLEGRPAEAGRNVLVRRGGDGRSRDLTPPGFNVRTRVHEYGGGAYAVSGGVVYFSNFADQRLYRLDVAAAHDAAGLGDERDPPAPVPLTPPGDWFYADATVDAFRARLICVREDHSRPDAEPVTTLVSIPLKGDESSGDVIASGFDFYSTPRLSPDGSALAWLAWSHPRMPWDGTELWVAQVTRDGGLQDPRKVAGGPTESIYQPGWSPDGVLYFVSDRDGWWRPYRCRASLRQGVKTFDPEASEPVLRRPPEDAEFGRPQWVFGTATWAFAGPSRIVFTYTRGGRWHLATADPEEGVLEEIPGALQPREWIAAATTHAVMVAGSDTAAEAVVAIDLATGSARTVRSASMHPFDPGHLSSPEPFEFESGGNPRVHGFYYPPHNKDFAPEEGERPPLVVITHGGPTTATGAALDLRIQYWTTRGFAVADVNYSGSSGYGRPYRERLNGHWGIVDVADTVNAARHLVAQGKADPSRLIVRGGSAGGYTTLATLTFYPDIFKAGASYYGISDIEVLVRETHKFESRYLETLVGPYPAMRDVYRARSPIHYVERLSCPLILFQGLEDRVVPPNQSEMMADAVRANGWPVAYLTFEGEQHGFRRAETIARCLEAELFFYGAVFGFVPADALLPVSIDNLRR